MDVGHGFFWDLVKYFLLFFPSNSNHESRNSRKIWENVEGIGIEGIWTGYSVVGILMMVP